MFTKIEFGSALFTETGNKILLSTYPGIFTNQNPWKCTRLFKENAHYCRNSNSQGLRPVCFLKAVEKWDIEE